MHDFAWSFLRKMRNFAPEIISVMRQKTAKRIDKASAIRHRAAMAYTVSQLTMLYDLDQLVEQKVAQILARQSRPS